EDEQVRVQLGRGESFVIGYVGRLVPEKGLALLLEAVAGLEGSWALAFVGTGPEQEFLEELARRRGIQDRIHFLGGVPHRELPKVISAMDVLVLPSLTTPRWKEQF